MSELLERFHDSRDRLTPIVLPSSRTVVVVPHPDDETLSTGGLLSRQAARGIPLVVVAVTDGEAAYDDWSPTDLAAVRAEEQMKALEELGAQSATIVRLGLPDSAVADHLPALRGQLRGIVRPGDLVVAPHPHDWHPDHIAVARAATTVGRDVGCEVLWGLFWAHHHPPHDLLGQLRSLSLTPSEVVFRLNALACHGSQLSDGDQAGVLDPHHWEHLRSAVEYYVSPR